MIGIDVGATKITQSNRVNAVLGDEVPRDLVVRVGEDRPVLTVVGDEVVARAAHDVYAAAVAGALQHEQAGRPDGPGATVAVPGWWGPSAVERVRDALAAEGLTVLTVTDAEAAVVAHQADGGSLPPTVAVVSLRATHAGVVIVRECTGSPAALPSPALMHDEGGDHLDTAVLRHLLGGLFDIGDAVDTSSARELRGAGPALAQCRRVREALSTSATESLRLELPGVTHSVRLVRSELEEVARPWADAVVEMVASAIGRSAEQVNAVLLTGGLAAMPLVSQRLSADLGLDVHMPESPELVVARGADRLGAAAVYPKRRRRFPWPRRSASVQTAAARGGASLPLPPQPTADGATTQTDEFFQSVFEVDHSRSAPAPAPATDPARAEALS